MVGGGGGISFTINNHQGARLLETDTLTSAQRWSWRRRKEENNTEREDRRR